MSDVGVTVKFFASLREVVGVPEMQISASSLCQLKTHLKTQLPAPVLSELLAPNVRVAVNQALIEDDDLVLADGDEVAFLPPVTGG
ncbi:MAG: MoaD/ThiS family protein [Pseudomonadota bacterium]